MKVKSDMRPYFSFWEKQRDGFFRGLKSSENDPGRFETEPIKVDWMVDSKECAALLDPAEAFETA